METSIFIKFDKDINYLMQWVCKSLVGFLGCGGKKQLFYFFECWLFVVGKNKCAVCAVGFLSSKCCCLARFSALCTTVCI
jgi:hypothetical protein